MTVGGLPLCSSRFFWFPNDIDLKKLLLFYEKLSISNIDEEIEIASQYKFHIEKESLAHSKLFNDFINGLELIKSNKLNFDFIIQTEDSLPDYVNSIEAEILTKSQQIFFSGNYRESMMFVLRKQLGPDTSKYPPPHVVEPMELVRFCYKDYFDKITKQYSCVFNTINVYDKAIPTLFDVTRNQFHDPETQKDMINMTLLQYPVIDTSCDWNRIIDFKLDNDSNLNHKKFMNWFNKLTSENFNPKDYMQEFEYLVKEYENSLNLHKMKFNQKPLTTKLLNSIEIMENIIKLNVSDAIKKILNFSKDKLEYLEAKKNLAGSEIAYLFELKEEFGD